MRFKQLVNCLCWSWFETQTHTDTLLSWQLCWNGLKLIILVL